MLSAGSHSQLLEATAVPCHALPEPQSLCFLLVFSMNYSGFIEGNVMTFPGPFSTKKLRCLLSSPNTHNLDRYYVHNILNMCWLVLYVSVVPHQYLLALPPVLEPTLHAPCSHVLPTFTVISAPCMNYLLSTCGSLPFPPPSELDHSPDSLLLATSSLRPAHHLCSGALRNIVHLHHLPFSCLSIFSLCFVNSFPFS